MQATENIEERDSEGFRIPLATPTPPLVESATSEPESGSRTNPRTIEALLDRVAIAAGEALRHRIERVVAEALTPPERIATKHPTQQLTVVQLDDALCFARLHRPKLVLSPGDLDHPFVRQVAGMGFSLEPSVSIPGFAVYSSPHYSAALIDFKQRKAFFIEGMGLL